MTFLEKTQSDCQQSLEKGDLEMALKQLKTALSKDASVRNDLTLILGRYNSLLREEAFIEAAAYRLEKRLVAKSIETFVGLLGEEDVSEGVFVETLLIICNSDKREDMEAFFNKKYFPNAAFINYGETLPKGIYDVIVLEDEDNIISELQEDKMTLTLANQQRRKDMKGYIDNTNNYFLYIGKRFELGYENRVSYSNSRFTTFARLKELLDYVKYYGK
jgi:hypothetical protein